MNYNLLLLIGLYFIYPIESTLGPGDRKSSSRSFEKTAPSADSNKLSPSSPPSSSSSIPKESAPPTDINVIQRNLLDENIDARSILGNYKSYCTSCADIRQFTYPTLIYITPWNNHGYDIVKIFPHKFDYVSPVWFSLKRIGLEKYTIEGIHDIDSQWIETLKEKRSDIRIVPRVVIEKWSTDDIHALSQSETEKEKLSLTLKDLLIEYNHLFDGYVLELLAQFHGLSKPTMYHIINDIAEQIHSIETNTTQKKEVFLAAPPLEEYFNREDFEVLSKYLDGFNIMTYDFPSNEPAPIAPIRNNSLLLFFFL